MRVETPDMTSNITLPCGIDTFSISATVLLQDVIQLAGSDVVEYSSIKVMNSTKSCFRRPHHVGLSFACAVINSGFL